MNIAIVYDSKTGRTASAAEAMGKTLGVHGHHCQVQSVAQADPTEVAAADLICLGTWVKGLFIILQHPNPDWMQFIDRFGNLDGKNVVVFCTYLLAAGSALPQMRQAVEGKGAKVVGQFKYRGPEPSDEFAAFAASLT
jgi:flavodoxin